MKYVLIYKSYFLNEYNDCMLYQNACPYESYSRYFLWGDIYPSGHP